MPSSSFIVNSEFQPMSYQELLHPVITQTLYQRELDEKYTQLDLQADKLEQLANSAVDRASYEKYKSFANRLREEANNLATYGLRGRDSARFTQLFRDYGKEIQPLLDAQAKRERLILMLQLLSMQDPTSLYDRSAGNISLEELMANPSAAPVRQSGELLRALAAAMANNLQNELRQATFSKTETPGYLAFTLKYGLSSAEVAAFVNNPNDPKASKVLRAIYDLVMTSSGVKENWEGDAYNRASQYVGMGLWNAIGKQAVQPYVDNVYMANLQFAHQKELQDRAHRLAMARQRQQAQLAAQQARANNIPSNLVPTYANQPEKVEKDRKEFNNWVNKKYIAKNKDGSYRITDAGMRALFSKESYKTYGGTKGPDIDFIGGGNRTGYAPKYFNQDFYNFMKGSGMLSLGTKATGGTYMRGSKPTQHRTIDRNQLSKNINTFVTANKLGYDIKMTPLLAHNIGTTEATNYKKSIALNISDTELDKLGITRGQILKGSGNTLYSSEDKITMPLLIDGKVVNVPVPELINTTLIQTVTGGVKKSLDMGDLAREIAARGQLPTSFDENNKPKTWKKATTTEIGNYINDLYYGVFNETLPGIERARANILVPINSKSISIDYTGGANYGDYSFDNFVDDYQRSIEE